MNTETPEHQNENSKKQKKAEIILMPSIEELKTKIENLKKLKKRTLLNR